MAYTPKEWQDGELFDAEGANHIEQGIATAQETADEALAGGGSGGDYASKEHYGDDHISVGRLEGSDVGENSIAFGTDCEAGGYNSQAMGVGCGAYGYCSHAEGQSTIADIDNSHAEGYNTSALGEEAHAEGAGTTASGIYSHAEGAETVAAGEASHAEGYNTSALWEASHAEGDDTTASGIFSHAEGSETVAAGGASHAEGEICKAEEWASHAEGYETTASGSVSHAEGIDTVASGYGAHASGCYTQANNYAAFACGKFNKEMNGGGAEGNTSGDAFVVGNGTGTSLRGNALRVTYTGEVYALSAFNASGADYAEFVKEWADGNPDGEDRVGYFVTVRDGYLCKADAGDYIVGVTSGNPSVVGNSDEDYHARYERDVFGRLVYEDVEEEATEWSKEEKKPIIKKTGNIIKNGKIKHAADYDAAVEYVHRKDRPEWDYVGMIGVLPVRDDGTCQAGQFCRCADGGIATPAEQRGLDAWMVLERVSENVVKIIMR